MAKNFAVSINLNKNELQNAVVQNLASDPGSPVEGQIYFNTTSHKMRQYQNGAWADVGGGGGGDASTNTSSSVDNEVVLFSGTGGKTLKRATATGIAKLASGVLSAAAAGTDYTSPSSTESFTNKTFDANGTGNSISNLEVADFATNVVDPDGTLAANSSSRIPSQSAVKTYVDALSQGLKWKAPVRAASTGNVTLATAVENGDTLDGVTLATGDRILLKDQSTGAENGIYVVAASGAPSRATDADTGTEVKDMVVVVEAGTVNADKAYKCSNDGSITIGSTSLTFIDYVLANVPAATTSTAGKVELATQAETEAKTDTDRAVTPASLTGFTQKKTFTIGDGSTTSFALSHNLGTKDVTVSVRKASTDDQWMVDVNCNSTNQVTLTFAVAPSSNEFVVTVIG